MGKYIVSRTDVVRKDINKIESNFKPQSVDLKNEVMLVKILYYRSYENQVS
jgi:hypothetical protein